MLSEQIRKLTAQFYKDFMKNTSPDQLFGQLFIDLHASGLFPDGKVISDALPELPPDSIMQNYRSLKQSQNFDIQAFFDIHFSLPLNKATTFKSDISLSVEEHIESLWAVLYRRPKKVAEGNSLIALPYPYVVPGGRFNEIYYWDSYFTMLGLQVSGRENVMEFMIKNFAWMLSEFGMIPNGNRSYYLTRSQPPFFALMIKLLSKSKGDQVYIDYYDALKQEYQFWMNPESGHKVSMPNGAILNRYYDARDTPRPEMYSDDVELSKTNTHGKNPALYRNLRSAAESGWDFSSRWLSDPKDLVTIRATSIVPIDLNCLLYFLEESLSKAAKLNGDEASSKEFQSAAIARKDAINKYCWNAKLGFYTDYDIESKALRPLKSLAGIFPLFFKIASDDQANSIADIVKSEFLKPGGVVTTTINSGQQWDAPNGWAPLQWITFMGLKNYGHQELANQIKDNWLALNRKVFKNTGKMLEKYDVEDIDKLGGGGEYPVQDGFGWTNGVFLKLASME